MLFEPGAVPAGPPLDTKKGLILLDFQNDFVEPTGNLVVSNVQSFVPKLLSLVDEFRAKGQIIWVTTEYRQSRTAISRMTGSHSILLKQNLQQQGETEERSEFYNNPGNVRPPREDPLSPSSRPDPIHDREDFLAPIMTTTKLRCCIPGSWGAEYPDCIKSARKPPQDLVMEKSHYSAFEDTNLLMYLRTHLITELYVCGTLSNVGVYSTVLDAVCHGVQVTLVEDCLGYLDEACHIEAMRQMADNMGARGVDCQELRDDLAGLLGDVVREEDYTTRFQVSLPPPARTRRSHTSRQQIHDWISTQETQTNDLQPAENKGMSSKPSEEASSPKVGAPTPSESLRKLEKQPSTEQSPSRKRSPSDEDPLDEDRVLKLSQKPSSRRKSTHLEQMQSTSTPKTTRKRRASRDASTRSLSPTKSKINRTRSAEESSSHQNTSPDSGKMRRHSEIPDGAGTSYRTATTKKKKKTSPNILGVDDKIGEGDTNLFLNILDHTEAEQAFYCCKNDVQWQKMFHRSGEVPRLVAVQGLVVQNGTEAPIYRHPADESPELLPFDAAVNMMRKAAEKIVQHPLNHALIQWYRNSEDNISEHSDKTLDIVRGSSIVNMSLGAQRTMILRAKKASPLPGAEKADIDTARPSQRVPLPHNSVFVLGQSTNQHWLHSIRADKRPVFEKTPAELAFNGERISITFRHIGTFFNIANNSIWGQGATCQTRDGAKPLLTGTEAKKAGEDMIKAFGQENHASIDWDWDQWYGKGFDVVNFETKCTQFRECEGMSLKQNEVDEKKVDEGRAEYDDTGQRAESVPF